MTAITSSISVTIDVTIVTIPSGLKRIGSLPNITLALVPNFDLCLILDKRRDQTIGLQRTARWIINAIATMH